MINYSLPPIMLQTDMQPRRLRIYIAGPYTGDQAANVRAAIMEGDYVARMGHLPFIPHLTHFWDMMFHHPYEFWMGQDLEWLKLCDAVLRIGGASKGADREVDWALSHGMPVYRSVFEIPPVDDKKV